MKIKYFKNQRFTLTIHIFFIKKIIKLILEAKKKRNNKNIFKEIEYNISENNAIFLKNIIFFSKFVTKLVSNHTIQNIVYL